MVPLDEVNLAVDGAAAQAVGQVLHVSKGVPVRGGDGIRRCRATRSHPSWGPCAEEMPIQSLDLLMIPALTLLRRL